MFQIALQVYLHLLYRLIAGRSPLDTEVFIQQGSMQSSDKAVALCGLRTLVVRCSIPSSCRNKIVGMVVRAPTELAPVVRQDGIDPSLMGFKERQHRFV